MRQALHGIIVALLLGLHPMPPVAVLGRNSASTSHTFTHTSNYAQTGSNSGDNMTLTLPTNPTTGNVLLGCLVSYNGGSNTPPTVTVQDGAGTPNVYTVTTYAGGLPTYNGFAFIFYLLSAPSSANNVVNITSSASFDYSASFLEEFSVSGGGSASLDGSPVANNGSNVLPVVPLGTGANDLFWSCATNNNNLSGVGSPWAGVDSGGVIGSSAYASYIANATTSTAVNYTTRFPEATAVVAVAIK